MLKDGVYKNLAFADYLKEPRENNGLIKRIIDTSVKHALESEPRKPSPVSRDKGSGVHNLADKRSDLVLEWPYINRKHPGWKQAKEDAEANGAVILPTPEFNDVHRAYAAVRAHTDMRAAYDDPSAVTELSVLGTHRPTGLKTKIRIDLYVPSRKLMVDLKTTAYAGPGVWEKQFYSLHYDKQAAFYANQAREQGLEVENVVFFVVENVAPFATHTFQVTSEVLERATEIVDETLVTLAEARKTGRAETGWPRYTPISLPHYLKQSELEF